MLDFVLELLLNGLGELLLEIIGATGGDRRLEGRLFVTVLAGLGLGLLSTLVFPGHFIHDETLRRVNLAVGPAFVGFVSGLVASARQKEVAPRVVTAVLFSFAFTLVRWRVAGGAV